MNLGNNCQGWPLHAVLLYMFLWKLDLLVCYVGIYHLYYTPKYLFFGGYTGISLVGRSVGRAGGWLVGGRSVCKNLVLSTSPTVSTQFT